MHTITITRTNINQGKKRNCSRCPAALALRKHFCAEIVDVNLDKIRVDNRHWDTPSRLATWICRFDSRPGAREQIPILTFRLR